jgi:hypothetical protein
MRWAGIWQVWDNSTARRVVVEKPEGNKLKDLAAARRTILKCTLAKQNRIT